MDKAIEKFSFIWTIIVSIYDLFLWWQWIIIFVGGYYLIKFLITLARYIHRRLEYNSLEHMRITMPRSDSKLDQEKRTEKDFREQLGKAEQFFRAIHETRDLNLYNVIFKRFLWRKPIFSFELQFKERELSFTVVCDTYYQKIIRTIF